jgi:hypothetical protein
MLYTVLWALILFTTGKQCWPFRRSARHAQINTVPSLAVDDITLYEPGSVSATTTPVSTERPLVEIGNGDGQTTYLQDIVYDMDGLTTTRIRELFRGYGIQEVC